MSDKVTEQLNRARVMQRSCESLIGICVGILADTKLNEAELRFLDLWLLENRELTRLTPGDEIFAMTSQVLADGVVTAVELDKLKTLLLKAVGGGFESTGTAASLPTQLPFDIHASVEWSGKSFCFTGKFRDYKRKDCELEVRMRGGVSTDRVSRSLDYLVIGSLVSPDWKYSTHGSKIETVMANRHSGATTQIISEKQWVKALGS